MGNDAMVKVLDSIRCDLGGRKLVSLEEPGSEYRTAHFRVHAVVSRHSPQIGWGMLGWRKLFLWMIPWPNVSLWRGEDEHPARELPVRIGTWTGGTTLALVIELIDEDDHVAFRIYYQDSPTVEPYGYPDWPHNTDPYHLAVLCVGGSSEYRRFPGDNPPASPYPSPPTYVHECIHYAPG